MTREEAVIILDGFKNNPLFSDTHAQALDMAIASLKTDEAYQLEYENRDFVEIPKGMTNGEVIQALFPNPHIETKSHTVWVGYDGMSFTREWWNAPYQKGGETE
jgi:hypothetical protein